MPVSCVSAGLVVVLVVVVLVVVVGLRRLLLLTRVDFVVITCCCCCLLVTGLKFPSLKSINNMISLILQMFKTGCEMYLMDYSKGVITCNRVVHRMCHPLISTVCHIPFLPINFSVHYRVYHAE